MAAGDRVNPTFVEKVMRLWSQGKDTWTISKILEDDEFTVCKALRIGREQQRTKAVSK
jgi:hypothetical protein